MILEEEKIFVPDLRGKALSFSPLSLMLAVWDCHIWPLLYWNTSFYTKFFEYFYPERV